MTAEREAMTLESIRDDIRDGMYDAIRPGLGTLAAWANVIDAYLSRAAEPVSAVSVWNPHEMTTLPATLTTTHPSEDARDAARWRWLKQRHADDEECDWIILGAWSGDLDAEIDAAMAKENGNAT